MARAIWKGVIRFGDVSVPVKLYSAVEDRSVRFRLLHETDLEPLRQRMIHPRTGEAVPHDATLRGVEAKEGVVVLDEDDLESLAPSRSRDIEVTRFVPRDRIDHRWYLRPYWLGPDESSGSYAALAGALGDRELEGVARWTMRRKRYRGALGVRMGHLVLVTLRASSEVVTAEELGSPARSASSEAEREMARRLVDALSGDFEPELWPDTYRERVLELVEAKASGKVVEFEPVRREAPSGSLEDVLAASLERARGERASA